jgi:hypothetical protein
MKTRRELAQKQLELMNDIRAKSNINMVTCGHCGTILLHEINEENIECFGCKSVLDQCDCPDLWYEGCIENREFNED